jgi:hypothetical protein
MWVAPGPISLSTAGGFKGPGVNDTPNPSFLLLPTPEGSNMTSCFYHMFRLVNLNRLDYPIPVLWNDEGILRAP